MTRLTAEHFPPLVTALRQAIVDGDVTVEQGKDFVDLVTSVVMEAMVEAKRFGIDAPRPPRAVVQRPDYPIQRMAGERRPVTGSVAERVRARRAQETEAENED